MQKHGLSAILIHVFLLYPIYKISIQNLEYRNWESPRANNETKQRTKSARNPPRCIRQKETYQCNFLLSHFKRTISNNRKSLLVVLITNNSKNHFRLLVKCHHVYQFILHPFLFIIFKHKYHYLKNFANISRLCEVSRQVCAGNHQNYLQFCTFPSY